MEATINDTQMVLVTLNPDGPIDGVPTWNVVAGNGTLLSDPAHPLWDGSKPDGHQMFLVSETLPGGEPGPVDTLYAVEADADLGSGIASILEEITLHVINQASSLGLTFSVPQSKP
jgi:hypothetical protein